MFLRDEIPLYNESSDIGEVYDDEFGGSGYSNDIEDYGGCPEDDNTNDCCGPNTRRLEVNQSFLI